MTKPRQHPSELLKEIADKLASRVPVIEPKPERATEPATITFDTVANALKQGQRATRRVWAGHALWITAVGGMEVKTEKGETFKFAPFIAIAGGNGMISPWMPTPNDIFAEDWLLVV